MFSTRIITSRLALSSTSKQLLRASSSTRFTQIPRVNTIRNFSATYKMAISVGDKLPAPPASVWEGEPQKTVEIPTTGKIVIVGVPGAFTPPCSDHVPGYVLEYDDFVSKGVSDIYIVAINDIFVVRAWKKKLEDSTGAGETKVHFVSDSTGEWTKALGLEFDATGLLGGLRSKRYAAVVEDGTVKSLFVEDEAPNLTVSTSGSLLKTL